MSHKNHTYSKNISHYSIVYSHTIDNDMTYGQAGTRAHWNATGRYSVVVARRGSRPILDRKNLRNDMLPLLYNKQDIYRIYSTISRQLPLFVDAARTVCGARSTYVTVGHPSVRTFVCPVHNSRFSSHICRRHQSAAAVLPRPKRRPAAELAPDLYRAISAGAL